MNYKQAYWVARGYYDGRTEGVRHCDEHHLKDEERAAYQTGYDMGVSDYCCFELEEEV